MTFTADMFSRLYPSVKNPAEWSGALNKWMAQYGIDTLPRVVAFMAQCGHESQGFAALSENLNYSADALLKTWPSHFTAEQAGQYARQPEKIANRAYANRMGNGDEASGDGWRHRGAGLIQLTGKANQAALAHHVGMDIEQVGDYLRTIDGAVRSACWFWHGSGCNAFADRGDVQGCTRAINGGLNGLDDRKQRYAKVEGVLENASV